MSVTPDADERQPDSPENPHAGAGGSVVLDIGGDVGALIVTMPESMVSQEVDIEPLGSPPLEHVAEDDRVHEHVEGHGHGHGHGHNHRPHVAVVRRPVPGGGLVPSLVYPELTHGSYQLLPKGTNDVVLTVEVVGGEVTMETWPDQSDDAGA